MFGTGCHVEDHCSGVLTALEKGLPGEKYNIGGNSERTNLQVIEGSARRSMRSCPPPPMPQ
jgi:dTDP-glucose 4,6-dehydratase